MKVIRNNLLSIIKTHEETALRNVGKGCNYESYLLPASYPLIVKAMIEFSDQQCAEKDKRIAELEEALTWLQKHYTLVLNSEKYMNEGIDRIDKALLINLKPENR